MNVNEGMISILVPVFNEEANVQKLHSSILHAARNLERPFEILFIEDGSTDSTFQNLKALAPIKIIRLRKNYGQTSALDAGFQVAKGEIIVTLDGDLQNDPSDICKLIQKLWEGYDVVSGWRKERCDTFGRRLLSKLANWLTYKITGLYLHDSACGMKAYRKELLSDLHLYGEMHVILPAYLHARGAKVCEIPVQHQERAGGSSKHSFRKALKNLSDLLTVYFLSQYLGRPLLFFGKAALAVAAFGLVAGLIATILKILGLRNFGQTPLPLLTVFFFTIAFLLFMMGFLAELMIRIYWEAQKKTPYEIKEVIENKGET